jgi:glutamyl-tRNA(Gln) amidotransferase subunit D
MAEAGDKVLVIHNQGEEKGILMPSPKKEVVIIKLNSGYNMGFETEKVKEIKLLEKKETPKLIEVKKVKNKDGFKKVTILHCGGTIASKVDYDTGAVKAKFSPEELLEMFPELGDIVNLNSKLIANMLSENMNFSHYNLIAKEIKKEIETGTQGIIITHGTDTLHYTSAALSFILEGLKTPVLLVGAQRSSDRGSSDAFLNLKCAAKFIAETDFAGVAVCMHTTPEDESCAILPGVKVRKMHSSRRDAFKPINTLAYALVNPVGKVKWLNPNYTKTENSEIKLRLLHEKLKIGILKSHPQMYHEEIDAYQKFDGILLEGTGLGHFPVEKYDDFTSENEEIYNSLVQLAQKIPTVMTLQTIFGVVNMDVYSPGRKLIDAGVLGSGLDITPETAFIKLAWLLSNYEKKDVKDLWYKDFRGELNKQISYQKDFLGI